MTLPELEAELRRRAGRAVVRADAFKEARANTQRGFELSEAIAYTHAADLVRECLEDRT